MASRDRRRDAFASFEDDRRVRKRRSSPSDSDREYPRDRRHTGEYTDDRKARHHERHPSLSDSNDDRRARRRRHRRDRSPMDSRRRDDAKDDDRRERRYRHRSRSRDRSRHHRRSRSPPAKKRRKSKSISPSPPRRSRAPLPSQVDSFHGNSASGDGPPPAEKQKPNFKPTGLLAKEANTVAGTTTVLKYHEPPEARKPPPKEAWRMYVFKKKDLLDTIYLHQRSCWLVGRDQKVTDLLLEHPSISKQHAVLQFRFVTSTNEFGDKTSKVKPYLIDLESANGTKLNGEKAEASRFVELVDGDVVRFGDSEREYVLMLPPP